ncbi:hypothetical protein F503_08344 [Ophiostoma piceae UAMH 11346]|uniref:Uncharacterized protein n=1 Tax=Ophiostoma piceae (strain UAMH 11346) TaxID=1262450 RepID=S3CHK1_OPHP1|nr:hypothetical protein F503_08344 [Ophiostoma piceae UAMH 11346]
MNPRTPTLDPKGKGKSPASLHSSSGSRLAAAASTPPRAASSSLGRGPADAGASLVARLRGSPAPTHSSAVEAGPSSPGLVSPVPVHLRVFPVAPVIPLREEPDEPMADLGDSEAHHKSRNDDSVKQCAYIQGPPSARHACFQAVRLSSHGSPRQRDGSGKTATYSLTLYALTKQALEQTSKSTYHPHLVLVPAAFIMQTFLEIKSIFRDFFRIIVYYGSASSWAGSGLPKICNFFSRGKDGYNGRVLFAVKLVTPSSATQLSTWANLRPALTD